MHTRAELAAGYRTTRLTAGRARLADQWFLIKPWAGVALVALVIALLLAVILPGFAG